MPYTLFSILRNVDIIRSGQIDFCLFKKVKLMRTLSVLEGPGVIEGSGDDVIQVTGDPSLATVVGNSEGRHFAITGFNPSRSLMVNTTDPYEGKVRVENGTFLMEITAVGEWSIDID